MKQFFNYGLKIACLSLLFLMPTPGFSSDIVPEDGIKNTTSCPYTSSADIPEGVSDYVAKNMMSMGINTALKVMACTGQLDERAFATAWSELQDHLKVLGGERCQALAAKITDDKVKMFLNIIPPNADYTLDIFFQHNTGRAEEILSSIEALQAQIFIEEDEMAKTRLQQELLYLGKRLHAANDPTARSITGTLLFGGLHDPRLEQAFLENAVEEVHKQARDFSENKIGVEEKDVLANNVFIILGETYKAGAAALSHIIRAGDTVTEEQKNLYGSLSAFYHRFYSPLIKQTITSDGVIDAYKEFMDLRRHLTYFHIGDEGHEIESPFPVPMLETVDTGDERATASIEASKTKLERTAELTMEMGAIPAQLENISARREAVGNDDEALAAIEADKAEIIARIMQIQQELADL